MFYYNNKKKILLTDNFPCFVIIIMIFFFCNTYIIVLSCKLNIFLSFLVYYFYGTFEDIFMNEFNFINFIKTYGPFILKSLIMYSVYLYLTSSLWKSVLFLTLHNVEQIIFHTILCHYKTTCMENKYFMMLFIVMIVLM